MPTACVVRPGFSGTSLPHGSFSPFIVEDVQVRSFSTITSFTLSYKLLAAFDVVHRGQRIVATRSLAGRNPGRVIDTLRISIDTSPSPLYRHPYPPSHSFFAAIVLSAMSRQNNIDELADELDSSLSVSPRSDAWSLPHAFVRKRVDNRGCTLLPASPLLSPSVSLILPSPSQQSLCWPLRRVRRPQVRILFR